MPFEYKFPRPMVTVDVLTLHYQDERLEILLIERKNPPFQGTWAFPGGFVEMNENLDTAASRELSEETSLSVSSMFPLFVADQPQRDPRGRTITQLFCGILNASAKTPNAGDDASGASWFPLNHLPSLAFDHSELIDRAKTELLFHFLFRFRLLAFFEKNLTLQDLKNILNELRLPEEYANQLAYHALKMGLIKETDKDHYIRILTDEELIRLDDTRLLRTYYETE
jgi:8-oxo-dGTP diphosphatase